MKHKSKDRLARSLASQLTNFYPDYVDTFLCPTCLTPVPLADKDQISDAHIVPKSVGGTIRTVLCKPCNDKFGSTQDLWFGDALHSANVEHPYFQARRPPTKFEIEGMTVTGVYGVTESGGLRFTIFEDRIAPHIRAAIKQRFAGPPPHGPVTVRVNAPAVFHNVPLVSVGALTAGYLLWFRELGYSWVLQRHLDVVRRQILNPTERILPKAAVVSIPRDPQRQDPYVGFVTAAGESWLFAAVGRLMSLFPPVDKSDLYGTLPDSVDGLTVTFREGHHGHHHGPADHPFAFMNGNRFVVAPDVFDGQHPVLYIASGREKPVWLHFESAGGNQPPAGTVVARLNVSATLPTGAPGAAPLREATSRGTVEKER